MTVEAMKHNAGECPDLETVAAYLDGRLDGAERARVTVHLASCEECYFVFSEAAQTHLTKKAVEPQQAPWWRSEWLTRPMVMWPSLAGALATAATLWLAVGTGELARWRSGEPRELQALVTAVGTNRTIEPRLTGGFAYGPLRGTVRGDESARRISPDVRIAAAEIEKDAGTTRTQETMRTLGIAHLVVGDVDRAVTTLEAAANESTADAKTFSDLSAAYLVRAADMLRAEDVSRALATAERAIQMKPRLAEARFNRANALERASRPQEALSAWRDYLEIDNRSGWADEARAHVRALEQHR